MGKKWKKLISIKTRGMSYAKTDWTSNVPSGLTEEEENWLAGKLK